MNDIEYPIDETIARAIQAPIAASLEHGEEGWILVMRRRFAQTPDRLWAMLTEPDLLARWSPVVPDRPLTSVGPASCVENPGEEPRDAEVLAAEAPGSNGRGVLTHRWGSETVLTWSIAPIDGGTTLELRQRLAERSDADVWAAAGWRICIGRLAAEDGTPRERVVGQRAMAYGWEALRDAYTAEFAERESESAAG